MNIAMFVYMYVCMYMNSPYVVSKSLVSPTTGQKTFRYKCNSGNLGMNIAMYVYMYVCMYVYEFTLCGV
jgi:hypothetical protein